MKPISMFALCLGAFSCMTVVQVQAKAELSVRLSDGTHKMVKHKASGELYPMHGPVVRVYSKSGVKYDSIANDNENMRFLVKLSASCNRKIRDLSLTVNGVRRNVKHTSSKGKRVKQRGEKFVMPFSLPKISRSPLKACSNELDERVALGGKSKSSWMKRGFIVRYADAYEAKLTGSCSAALGKGDFASKTVGLPVWIICEPIDNPRTPKANTGTSGAGHKPPAKKGKPRKLALQLQASPKVSETCPAKIKFSGKITSSRATEVKYRIVGKDSPESWATPVRTLKFEKPGSRSISQWSHTFHKPDTSQSLAVPDASGPKMIQGRARILIIEPAKGVEVSGGKIDYQIWCEGKPKRQQKQAQPLPVKELKPLPVKQPKPVIQ